MNKVNEKFWKDFHWGEKNQSELLKTFRDQWVAIQNKQVIASGKDLAKVKEKAMKKSGEKAVPLLFVEGGDHLYAQS